MPFPRPRIAIHGDAHPFLCEAVAAGGGVVVGVDQEPDGLVLDHANDKDALKGLLEATPSVRWVQLPTAGIESYAAALAAHPEKVWTSAKGAYARPVAEHAVALTLALLRRLPERIAARSWGEPSGTSLYGRTAVVVGAGGIGLELLRLFGAFAMDVDVVRRTPSPVEGARRTVTPERLLELLPKADVVVLAAALTSGTRKLIGAPELAAMKPEAVLVNVARGGLLDTDALVRALAGGEILGAGLDVTDPEPLPAGHPLWDEPRAIITPHTADTLPMIRPLLGERIEANVRNLGRGMMLEGLVDASLGY